MSFRPSSGRRISGGGGGVVDNKIEAQSNNTEEIINDDDINSYSSSDYDNPYHETASTWYNRSAKRRARRQAGISSSSSSEESSDSGLESDNEDGNNNLVTKNDIEQQSDKRKEMNKAIRSANRPFEKWLASYPLVASRCCLSSMPPTSTTNSMDINNHAPQYNTNTQLSLRDQETKKLRRILRRLRRKQKEFQIKFTHDNNDTNTSSTEQQQTNTNNNSSYYQTSNALSIEQMTKINADCAQESESDAFAINSFIPQGLGISFIDAILGKESVAMSQQQQQSKSESDKQQHTASRMVLELNGPARCGQTSILIAAAARYVASTSNIFLEMECEGSVGTSTSNDTPQRNTTPLEGQTPRSAKRRKLASSSSSATIEPRVVILDLEKGIHAVKLILSVREAVLRRWDETAAARQWKREQAKLWKLNATGDKSSQREEEMGATMNEQRQIELAITSCLGRINIVQPRDFTYLSLVATIEALGHSLDKERGLVDESNSSPKKSRSVEKQNQPQQPPTLIMIDSLTTLDASTRHLESLPTSSTSSGNKSSGSNTGLSERNEFYRQLIRLREEHEVAIIATSRSIPSANNSGSSKRGGATFFDKMVSHRVTLHHVVEGTREDQAGYDFVATLNKEDAGGVYPYSVTAGGVYCG